MYSSGHRYANLTVARTQTTNAAHSPLVFLIRLYVFLLFCFVFLCSMFFVCCPIIVRVLNRCVCLSVCSMAFNCSDATPAMSCITCLWIARYRYALSLIAVFVGLVFYRLFNFVLAVFCSPLLNWSFSHASLTLFVCVYACPLVSLSLSLFASAGSGCRAP